MSLVLSVSMKVHNPTIEQTVNITVQKMNSSRKSSVCSSCNPTYIKVDLQVTGITLRFLWPQSPFPEGSSPWCWKLTCGAESIRSTLVLGYNGMIHSQPTKRCFSVPFWPLRHMLHFSYCLFFPSLIFFLALPASYTHVQAAHMTNWHLFSESLDIMILIALFPSAIFLNLCRDSNCETACHSYGVV